MKKTTKRSFLALTLFALMSLGACNTIHGAGQDISKGGQAIERSSDKAGANPD